MNTNEKLHQYAYDNNVNVHNFYLGEENLKGLYIDGNIAINTSVSTSAEESCVIVEELGHHFTSVGDVLDPNDLQARKQEQKARLWGYNKLIGLSGLIRAFEHGCKNKHDIAEFLDVTEEFLEDAIKCYTQKYGTYANVDNYFIMFIPYLAVMKRI